MNLRNPTREEETLAKRVLNWDYFRGHDIVEFFPTETLTLFYGYKNAAWAPHSLLGVIDSNKIGIMTVSRDNGLKVGKRRILDRSVVNMYADPIDIERNIPQMPDMHYAEFSKKPKLMKELVGLFHDTFDMWRSFQLGLSDEKMKRYFSTLMGKDLDLIQEEVTLGHDALMNTESCDPVHDFLMIVDSVYRGNRQSYESAMAELDTVALG